MALDGSIQRPFGNPANYLDPELATYKNIPPYWGRCVMMVSNIMAGRYLCSRHRYTQCPGWRVPSVPDGPDYFAYHIGFWCTDEFDRLVQLCQPAWHALGRPARCRVSNDRQSVRYWTRIAHPDTLQVLFALLALVIGLRHSDRGDFASLAALGLMCGFVQGAKAGGPGPCRWHSCRCSGACRRPIISSTAVKSLLGRGMFLGSGVVFGYFVSTPYAFPDPYLFRSYRLLWNIQGLGASTDGPFGRVTIPTWVQAIYAHIGPLATALASVAIVRSSSRLSCPAELPRFARRPVGRLAIRLVCRLREILDYSRLYGACDRTCNTIGL